MNGEVAGTPAEVVLDVAQPLSRVTEGCFGEDVPSSGTSVRIPTPQGEYEVAEVISFSGARIGGRRLGELRAALDEGDACEVTVGSEVLTPYALEIDPARRVLRILPTRARADYAAQVRAMGSEGPDEIHLLELLRDPEGDWPLLAARVSQESNVLTGPFVVSTAAAETVVASSASESAGLERGPAFMRELGVPAGRKLPPNLGGNAIWANRIELAPGFGFREVIVGVDEGWKGSAVGVLGGDVWGRFHATVDPAAGVLFLRRPRVVGIGTRQRCAVPEGDAREEACFVLEQREAADGVEVVTTVWRDLPKGARVYLDPVDSEGRPIGAMCRVGMTFPEGERGVSAAHHLPWEAMAKTVPECAQELAQLASFRFSLMEEEPLDECPGTCAFAEGMMSQRVSCECVGSSYAPSSEMEQRMRELHRKLNPHRREQKAPPPAPDEPEDPQ